MKTQKFLMILVISFCMACQINNGDDMSTLSSLKGTKWKLAGIVDTETGVLKVLEPKDCVECYTLTFDMDSTATVLSIWAIYKLDLSHLDLIRDICKPDNMNGVEKVCLNEEAKDGISYVDSYLFRAGIAYTKSYKFTPKELKFYYNQLENHYCLIFKPDRPRFK